MNEWKGAQRQIKCQSLSIYSVFKTQRQKLSQFDLFYYNNNNIANVIMDNQTDLVLNKMPRCKLTNNIE